jgi:hypothetical protein
MMPTEVLQTALILLMFQLPLIATAVLGLWFAIVRRRLVARVALYAKWGFGLLIVYSLASVTLAVLTLQLRTGARAESAAALSENLFWLSLVGVVAYPLLIAGIALVARSVFIDR